MGRSRAFILAAGTICVFAQTTTLAFDGDERSFTRVRGMGVDMHRLIREADGLSRTFRSLVDEIQRSDAIVMVQFGLCASGQFRSCVMHVTGDERQRHIRILVNTRTTGDRLLATIAHELQHAVEIVRDPAGDEMRSRRSPFSAASRWVSANRDCPTCAKLPPRRRWKAPCSGVYAARSA